MASITIASCLCYAASLHVTQKEEITRGSAAPVSSKNVGIGKKVSEATPEESLEQQHPTNHVKKEEFVEYFGLISREALELRKQQQQSGKVQRRRRTATKNTRYTSNGFLKLEEIVSWGDDQCLGRCYKLFIF